MTNLIYGHSVGNLLFDNDIVQLFAEFKDSSDIRWNS